jgi:hypothetical protein
MAMSITEWVVANYSNTDKDINLEAAKNFTFIWSLFENMAKQRIFTGETLKFDEFFEWVDSLIIEKIPTGISITDSVTGNFIDNNLIENINKSFNHFYQKYSQNNKGFLDLLYNQEISQVLKEKMKFEEYIKNIDKANIKNKICFLFFITKRIRNKFFHGIKSIGQVSKDYKEFEKSSEYLISIISLIENYNQ